MLRVIPEDRSRDSGSNPTTHTRASNECNLPLPPVPPNMIKTNNITNKKKKPKTATKTIQLFDKNGNITREKKVKVDEFGNPLLKKKSKLAKRGSGSTTMSDNSVNPVFVGTPNNGFGGGAHY